MSAEATGYVFRHSPYSGTTFAVHLAIADTVNDQNGHRFWMSQSKTATKARTTRKSVNEALTRLEADGFLLRIGKGPKDTVAFVFLFPDVDAVYDSRPTEEVSRGVTPPADDPVTSRDTPCNESTQPLSRQVTQTQENPTEPNQDLSATAPPSPFDDDFADWWAGYPRKAKREAALKAYRARRREGATAEELRQARDFYALELEDAGTGERHTMHGATFLAPRGPWREVLDGVAMVAPGRPEPPAGPTFAPDLEQRREVGPYECRLGLGCTNGWHDGEFELVRCECMTRGKGAAA